MFNSVEAHWERVRFQPVEGASYGVDRRTGRFIDRWPTWN